MYPDDDMMTWKDCEIQQLRSEVSILSKELIRSKEEFSHLSNAYLTKIADESGYREALQEMVIAPFTDTKWYKNRAREQLELEEIMYPTTTEFGHALIAAQEGKMIYRKSWIGKFVFRQVPSTIDVSTIPRMTSLPEPVRAEFMRRKKPLQYKNQFAMVNDDNTIEGWSPSPADALADDWCILE